MYRLLFRELNCPEMSLKVERCIASPPSAPAGTTVHRLVSLTEEKVAFKVWIGGKSRYYAVKPEEGFIDSGEMIRLIVRPTTDQFPPANLMIKWAETDDDEDDVENALRGNGRSGQIIHPLNSKNLYDDKRYPSAMLKAYDDQWADLRRPWMLVKFGYATVAIRNEDLIWKAVEKITEELSYYAIFLEHRPLYYSLSCLVEKQSSVRCIQIANDIRRHLQAAQPSTYPVLLLIDDYEGKFTRFIKYHFSKDVYIFGLSGQEALDIASSSPDKPFRELRGWCNEFASLVQDSERGRNSPSPKPHPNVLGHPLENRKISRQKPDDPGGPYRDRGKPPDRYRLREDRDDFYRPREKSPADRRPVVEDSSAYRYPDLNEASSDRRSIRDQPSNNFSRLHENQGDFYRSRERPTEERHRAREHGSRHSYRERESSLDSSRSYRRDGKLDSSSCPRDHLRDESVEQSDYDSDEGLRDYVLATAAASGSPTAVADSSARIHYTCMCALGSPPDNKKIATAQDIALALDYANDNRSDENIVLHLAVPYLFNRLASPFRDIVPNINLMRLVHISCSVKSDIEEVYDASRRIIQSLISSRYIRNICDWFGYPAVRNSSMWSEDLSDLLVAVMHLFLIISKYDCYEEEVYNAWKTYYDVLTAFPETFWARMPARSWLEEMAKRLEHLGGTQQSREAAEEQRPRVPIRDEEIERDFAKNTTSERPPHYNDVREEVFAPPLWEECEKQAPPCDFRELSEIPVKKDIYNAEVSYLRRAIIDGKYNDAAHYLDVQFRLFREDLISPLRDGIAVYKRNGTTRCQKVTEDGDQVTSDLLIFEIEDLEGVQVRGLDGSLCRYARLTAESRSHPALSRNLMFGQIVCLSSDGFNEDMHLAKIVEREQTEENGSIAFTILDENGGIVKNRPYQIAEPQSYLVAYQHVLSALKSFSAYNPIPFERYIVYGKCDVRKPVYMRIEENVEDIVEDSEISRYYENVRKDARAVIAKSGDDYDSDLEEELETPIIKKKLGVINEYELERIKIKDKVHELSKLNEEFSTSRLDDSQRHAVIQALTSELAIIQGPPGTGKTFIGVEIARIMLQNRSRWGITEPILVIAFTNNAVDQFAEKLIYKVESDLQKGYLCHDGPLCARLGSKSESDMLKRRRFMKNDLVTEWTYDFNSDDAIQEVSGAFKTKRDAQQMLAEASFVLHIFKRSLIGYQALAKSAVIPERFKVELSMWKATHCDSAGHALDNDEALACWLLDKVYNKGESRMGMLPSDDEEDSEADMHSMVDDMEEGVPLEKLLEDVNQLAIDEEEALDEFYLTDRKWDIVRESEAERNVILLGKGYKVNTKVWNSGALKPVDRVLVNECVDAKESILKVKPMTPEDAENVKSIFSLTKQRRWELYMYWIEQLREKTRQQLPSLIEAFRIACERLKSAQLRRDAEVLRRCLVIFATTTGAAKERDLLAKTRCRVVFAEEAAEVLEAHILASLVPSVEHLVLIGDHQQLRPNPTVYDLAREYHLDVSMFERLVKNGYPFSNLKVQHRMNPDITENIIRPYFYPELIDDASVLEYPPVPGMDKRCFFWMHEVRESTTPASLSHRNDHEIKMAVELISYLTKQGIGFDEITVIAAYSAQMTALRESIGAAFGKKTSGQPVVAVETVDSFQGKENRIVIVSLVRSEMDGVGFLAVKNRITVALTRAQHGMYVVGNLGYLSECSSFWDKICNRMFESHLVSSILTIKCQSHGNVQEIEDPSEFAEKSPEGGCQEICGASLQCGHSCPRRCHPIDDHATYTCIQPCLKRCKDERYRHQCQRVCSEECGSCMHVVTVSLDCGHLTNVVCSALSTVRCGERCEKVLKCGHQCSNPCGKPCATLCREPVVISRKTCGHTWTVACNEAKLSLTCPMPCQEILPCGHLCAELCGQPCTFDCKAEVRRQLKCGHPILVPCCEDESLRQCQVPLLRELERCGHSVMIPCHAGKDSRYCPAVCGKQLLCGHQCLRNCGECYVAGGCKCESICGKLMICGHRCVKSCGVPCGPCPAPCLSSCKHQDCGSSDQIQTIKYGRTCSQPCVLCPKLCDNSCQHRSCGKKCYEVCDVKPCDQPCTQRLICGHACLGMCNEPCPRLCGTCSRQGYVSVISEYLGAVDALTKLPRIIEIAGCHHVFPVEYLDKHMTAAQNQSTIPQCPYPECGRPITRTQRYARILKKQNLDKYFERVGSMTTSESSRTKLMNGCWNILQKELADCKKIQKTASMRKVPKRHAELLNSVIDTTADASRCLAQERLTRTDLYSFWKDYTKLVVVLSRLTQSFVTGVPMSRSTPIVRELFFELVPRGRVHEAFVGSLHLSLY
ncbi:hypothetical protein Y032_0021g423 [Ancylostoma ceylanicum]|uniref:NF-X1-type domain-containing protein n=1 Tax=Ancylostoma ceylanicum TaxID=53326 RepID=A0A016V008_9BILA|nr:hypothetical protein Y032_0021g423 [Ancylostoma ceylanicum]